MKRADIAEPPTPVVAVTPKPERSIRWTIMAIMLTGPTLIGLPWWVIKPLTAPQWCAV